MRTSTLLAVTLATFGFAQLASADATANLSVSASVVNGCTITGNTLGFGAYNTVSGAAVNSSALIQVACTTGTETTITLGEGAHPEGASSATVPLRRMIDDNGNLMSYLLFSDARRLTVWGDTVGTGLPYTAETSAGADQTVFGRITANQDLPAGTYTDSVVATIAF
ncbi:MAG: spore coat U domain-containing protein [Kofleriaceae bacterium]